MEGIFDIVYSGGCYYQVLMYSEWILIPPAINFECIIHVSRSNKQSRSIRVIVASFSSGKIQANMKLIL